MKTNKRLFFYFFILIHLAACAQSKNVISKIHATFTIHIPGNIPVDRNGNEIPLRDTVYTIYAETTSPAITWSKAWINGRTYSIIPTLIDSDHIEAGTQQSNNERMVVKTAGGNKLWQLQLIPSSAPESVPIKASNGELILSGEFRNQRILQRIKSMTELVSLPTP